ncbi:hypothetical protein H5410_004936 [Solanum commersonii]|uniref:Uncharacterized protein n=1 Tax=Solanum commersonii TaxID=4109 RepID=A0A9J6A518_SOLCO|nr:hypothetical protein H5410_004936 [Solanum commersonii]
MDNFETPNNKRRAISFPTSSEVMEKLYYLKCDSYERMEDKIVELMEDKIVELMKRLIGWKGTKWVEIMLLMDDPPLTKCFQIYKNVVLKSPHSFTVTIDGVDESTRGVREVNSIDGWSEKRRGCQRSLQL